MQIKREREDFQNYLTDASNMLGGHADALALPETADEVAAVLREANESGTPVTISGARTGTVGGAIPFGGKILSLEKLNKIKCIDRDAMTAVVEAGVILGDLQKAVEADGLFYPPDPTEWSCQIGGTIATNASGARSFKYGATREFVNRLTVVLATGETIELDRGRDVAGPDGVIRLDVGGRILELKTPTYERPRVRKNVSGYFNKAPLDAIDLFIGSEGTLGVIVEAELRLLKKPAASFSGIVFFSKRDDLIAFVDDVRRASVENRADGDGIDAVLLEYFDRQALRFISEKFPETPANMAGAIYFEQETTPESEDDLLEAWNRLLEEHNAATEASWFTTTDADRERLREFRHALPVSVNEKVVRNKQKKVGTDMAVPDERFAGFLRFYERTLEESGLEYVIFGHIGDCHLHANMLPKDSNEADRARQIYGRSIAQAIMAGGTVSAEHGIGKLKKKYLSAMMGERYLNEMAAIKSVLDPNSILGRGNMFDESYLPK